MWKAYLDDGRIIAETDMGWKEAEKLYGDNIAKLSSEFGGSYREIEIPSGKKPVVFNTGEAEVKINTDAGIQIKKKTFFQLSQAIGHTDGVTENYLRLMFDGKVFEEVGPAVH